MSKLYNFLGFLRRNLLAMTYEKMTSNDSTQRNDCSFAIIVAS